jgi:hypothetical protein
MKRVLVNVRNLRDSLIMESFLKRLQFADWLFIIGYRLGVVGYSPGEAGISVDSVINRRSPIIPVHPQSIIRRLRAIISIIPRKERDGPSATLFSTSTQSEEVKTANKEIPKNIVPLAMAIAHPML